MSISTRTPTSYRQARRLIRTPGQIVAAVISIVLLVAIPLILQSREFFGIKLDNAATLGIGLPQLNLALIAVLAAIPLNLLVGMTGLISLGQAAFFAVGAFSAGLFGTQLGLPFPLVLLIAGVLGAVVGLLVGLPSLRLNGLYLMLATLALHFVVIFLFTQYQIANFSPAGIPFAPPTVGDFAFDKEDKWYWLLLVLAVLLILGVRSLMRSRHGRAFIAVRDNEIAAASLGINVARTRIVSFSFTSFLVSVVGALFAYYLGNIGESSFGLTFVVGYFAMILIGGMGSLAGPVFGALFWTLVPSILQTLSGGVPKDLPFIGPLLGGYQGQIVLVLMGIVILVLLRFQPGGLNALWQKVKGVFIRWPYKAKS